MENATIGAAARAGPPCPDGSGHETRLGRIGTLEARLACNPDEIAAAQEIRYRVFRAESGLDSAGSYGRSARDEDEFDAICDHLLVIDTAMTERGRERIVGTYRLLPQERVGAGRRFYSEQEFEFDRLAARHPRRRFLELGRSCVVPEYRTRRTVELLWQGIWAYCRRHGIDVMCGCASFPGILPAAHAEPLSFLSHFYSAEGDWHIRALPHRYCTMDLMPAEAIDVRSAVAALPPLIKGYLRLGARFGDGCVIDHEFGTTDVFVVLPVEAISERYVRYYGTDAERFAAR